MPHVLIYCTQPYHGPITSLTFCYEPLCMSLLEHDYLLLSARCSMTHRHQTRTGHDVNSHLKTLTVLTSFCQHSKECRASKEHSCEILCNVTAKANLTQCFISFHL